MVTKLTVAHCIMAYEAVYRIKPLLDQISEGLKSCNVLNAVQAFPELFLPLFVDTGGLSSEDVLAAVLVNTESDDPVIGHFKKYFGDCNGQGTQ